MHEKLWEVLVPVYDNDGVPFTMDHHYAWDDRVKQISKGLSIYRSAKGTWYDPEEKEYIVERMIPVRVFCTRIELEHIMNITIGHYDQKAVMAFMISDEIIVRRQR